jgi:hypothetical protein
VTELLPFFPLCLPKPLKKEEYGKHSIFTVLLTEEHYYMFHSCAGISRVPEYKVHKHSYTSDLHLISLGV